MTENPAGKGVGDALKSSANLNFDHYSLSTDQRLVKKQYFPAGKKVDSSRYPMTATFS